MRPWKKVKATLEEPQDTSLGDWPGDEFLGVALPSFKSLRLQVEVKYKDKIVSAMIHDVGPWCIDDDDYVLGDGISRAQRYKDHHCPFSLLHPEKNAQVQGKDFVKCNGAGIDLFPGTAKALGITGNEDHEVLVEWRLQDF